MRRLPILFAALLALSPAAAFAQHEGHDHAMEMPAAHDSAARDPNLPADEGHAREALDQSPRHGEFIDVPVPGDVTLRTWVSYPERPDRAGVVIVIHEVFGLSDWIRGVADQLAAEGFIAVVPDLVTGFGPNGGGTESVSSRDSVVAMVRRLTPEVTARRLDAVRSWALHEPSANGRVGSLGFCWGGGVSFAYASAPGPLAAAVVYYGTSPDSAAVTRLHAPVLGFYGGDDARVTTTVPPAERVAKSAKRSYDAVVFDGAGHGFLRQQSGRDGANERATRQAWPRTITFLRRELATKR
jgi:carboxymethylenebutenolidase